MLAKLIFLFVTVPLLDLLLLLWVSSYIGWIPSIAIVVFSGVVGALLARFSYRYVIYRFASKAQKLQFSSDLITDSLLIFLAAGMLLTPGFLTDLAGLLLLIPSCRNWLKARMGGWFQRNLQVESAFSFQFMDFTGGSRTVDGQVQAGSESRQPFSPRPIEPLPPRIPGDGERSGSD